MRPSVDGKSVRGKQYKIQRPDGSLKYNEVVRIKGMPFVIRYDAEDIGEIGLHKDNADVSFIVLLSDPGELSW